MKKRNPVAVCIFSIITFGIYDIVWLVKTKNAMNQRTRTKVPSIWLLFLPLLVFVAILILSIAAQAMASSGGHSLSAFAILLPLISFLTVLAIIPLTFYWFWKYSKAVNEYTTGGINTAVAFLLLWLLRFIGIAIVQDAFNDVIDAGGATAGLPAQPQPAYAVPPQIPIDRPPVQ